MSARLPLRPLLDILRDRQKGGNGLVIEERNLRVRNAQISAQVLKKSVRRIRFAATMVMLAFVVLMTQYYFVAKPESKRHFQAQLGVDMPENIEKKVHNVAQISSFRAPIYDRNGLLLAANMPTKSLVLRRDNLLFPQKTAQKLADIFPNRSQDAFFKALTSGSKFKFLERKLSAQQQAAVMQIGDPGLSLGDREVRVYPNGRLASHILGGTAFGAEGEIAAEVLGRSGVELYFDEYLRDSELSELPLTLSVDVAVQAAVEKVLGQGMRLTGAKSASAVLMDVHSGEIRAMASFPDYDPNEKVTMLKDVVAEEQVTFNHAVQRVAELGSTFKIFTAAQALEEGLMRVQDTIPTPKVIKVGRTKIEDEKHYGNALSLEQVIVKSSNVGSARVAMKFGGAAQRAFLLKFGLADALALELPETLISNPITLSREDWAKEEHFTRVSYGHSFSTTPVHLAAAYAVLGNGGRRVEPTLVKQDGPNYGEQILSTETAAQSVALLEQVVLKGTASAAQQSGYRIAGKTGSADILKDGKYLDDAVHAVFASLFPANNPQFVLVVALDDPGVHALGEEKRTAGFTAVPVAQEIVARAAPLLGLRPSGFNGLDESSIVFASIKR